VGLQALLEGRGPLFQGRGQVGAFEADIAQLRGDAGDDAGERRGLGHRGWHWLPARLGLVA